MVSLPAAVATLFRPVRWQQVRKARAQGGRAARQTGTAQRRVLLPLVDATGSRWSCIV